MMRICLCRMVDRRKTLNLISSWDHCRRFPPSQILDKPPAGLEPAQNLSSGFVEGSCMEIIINSLLCHNLIERYSNVNCLSMFFFKWPVWNQVLVFLLMRINNRLNEIVREINIKIWFFYTLFSNSDLLEILFTLCRSPRTAFCLYLLRTANDRSLGILYSATDVSMKPFLIIISVSQNLIGYMSMVNFTFWWFILDVFSIKIINKTFVKF